MLHNYSTIGLISNRKIQYILEAPISHRKKMQKKNTTHHPRRRNTWHSITVRTAIFLCKYRSFANPHRWYGRIWFDSLYWAANVVRNPMLISKSRGHIPVWRIGHMNATTWTLCYIHTYIGNRGALLIQSHPVSNPTMQNGNHWWGLEGNGRSQARWNHWK